MTFEEYLQKADEFFMRHAQSGGPLRKGQAYFNFLHNERPDLANKINGSDIDPFHDDSKLGAFCQYLLENWHMENEK